MSVTHDPRKNIFNKSQQDEFELVGFIWEKEGSWISFYRNQQNQMWFKNDEPFKSNFEQIKEYVVAEDYFPVILFYKKILKFSPGEVSESAIAGREMLK